MDNKKWELELLKAFPQWQNLSLDLQNQVATLHDELTIIDYTRDSERKFTLDDIKRAELCILQMLIDLPETLLEDLQDVISTPYEDLEEEQV